MREGGSEEMRDKYTVRRGDGEYRSREREAR